MINLQLDLQSHKNSVFMRGVPVPATKENRRPHGCLFSFAVAFSSRPPGYAIGEYLARWVSERKTIRRIVFRERCRPKREYGKPRRRGEVRRHATTTGTGISH